MNQSGEPTVWHLLPILTLAHRVTVGWFQGFLLKMFYSKQHDYSFEKSCRMSGSTPQNCRAPSGCRSPQMDHIQQLTPLHPSPSVLHFLISTFSTHTHSVHFYPSYYLHSEATSPVGLPPVSGLSLYPPTQVRTDGLIKSHHAFCPVTCLKLLRAKAISYSSQLFSLRSPLLLLLLLTQIISFTGGFDIFTHSNSGVDSFP